MKPPIVIGIVLGAVIVAAGLFAPLLGSSAKRSAVRATAQASQALEALNEVDVGFRRVDRLVERDPNRVEAAAESAADELRQISEEYNRAARAARQEAEELHVDVPPMPPMSPDASGARRAIQTVDGALKDNLALLNKAVADARAAVGVDAETVGVAQSLGAAEYLKAVALMAEATELRTAQATALANVLTIAAERSETQGRVEYFRGLDMSPIQTDLEEKIAEVQASQVQAEERAELLREAVSSRMAEVAAAEAELEAANEALRVIVDGGFDTGDEQAFRAYRERYRDALRRVRLAEAMSLELRYGGRRGAVLVGDDPTTAGLEGGEDVVGLEELQRRLAAAEKVVERWSSASAALQERVEHVRSLDTEAQADAREYEGRVAALDDALRASVAELELQSEAARAKEDEALAAAQSAMRSFGQSQRAVDAWTSEAQQLQRDRDPDLKNERLSTLINAPYMKHFGASAEAAALVLTGYVRAQRIESNQRLIQAVRLLAQSAPSLAFDASPYQTEIEEARAEALQSLEKARSTFDRLSKKPTATSWVPLSSLAAAHYLTARIDAGLAAEEVAQALEIMGQALEQREQFPYIKPLLVFYTHIQNATSRLQALEEQLGADALGAPVQPPPEAPEETPEEMPRAEPAGEEPTEADEDDFFLDDE